MDILVTALAAITTIVIYYAVIQRERILLLTEQIDALKWQLTSQQQRAEALCESINNHLQAKAMMDREMDKLEAQLNWLRHKRSGRNAEVMKHAVYGHPLQGRHRGH